MNSNRGMSTIGIVVVLIILAGAAFAGTYFFSDVFKTKVDSAVEQFAKWTPENIAKDPKGYLDFCEAQVKASIDKAKASEIAIGQKKGMCESKRDDAKKLIETGEKALTELKAAYLKAEADKAWPVSWQSTKLDQDAAKRQIMTLARQVKSQGELMSKYEAAIQQLTVSANKTAELKDRAKEQLAKIDASRATIKVQQITDDLKNTLVNMKGAIETSIMGVASSDNTGSLSLEDIAAKNETKVDDKEFDKVMGK